MGDAGEPQVRIQKIAESENGTFLREAVF